jgi:hypothetical protein
MENEKTATQAARPPMPGSWHFAGMLADKLSSPLDLHLSFHKK